MTVSYPPLPGGDDVMSEAVRSVHRRGFHDELPPVTLDRCIMTQLLRLVEEVGEFEDALRQRADDLAEMEASDVIIVCGNLYWLMGGNPANLSAVVPDWTWDGYVVDVGALARGLRGQERDGYATAKVMVEQVYSKICGWLLMTAGAVDGPVAAKLTADEGRGRLHQGGRV